MPLYEYECPSCGTFERVQKFSDPILTACPTCEKPVEKLLSAPAIQFKGTGWYVTDYAKGSGGEDASGGEKASGEPKTKASGGDRDTSSSKDKPAKKDSSPSSSSKGKPSK